MKYILTLEYTTLAGLQEAVKLLEGEVTKVEAVQDVLKEEPAPRVAPSAAPQLVNGEAPKRARGRPPKAHPVVEVVPEPSAFAVEAAKESAATLEEALVPEELEEPPALTAPTTLTFETDIIPAFQAFAKRNSRDAAIAVLTSYGVKSVREIPPKFFTEVMEKLS